MSGKNLYEVLVKHTVTIVVALPVSADSKADARGRAERIVKSGNARVVGGREGTPLTDYKAYSVTRLGRTP